jgi:hypothetical protein
MCTACCLMRRKLSFLQSGAVFTPRWPISRTQGGQPSREGGPLRSALPAQVAEVEGIEIESHADLQATKV